MQIFNFQPSTFRPSNPMQLLLGFFLAISSHTSPIARTASTKAEPLPPQSQARSSSASAAWIGQFYCSRFLSHLPHSAEHSKNANKVSTKNFPKGHERDAGQVFGNGGIATAFAALHFFFPNELWPWLGFAAALAAVNADTWATELGVLNPHPPRMITDLRKVVEKGTSGGISLIGTLAALAGSALIGILAAIPLPNT